MEIFWLILASVLAGVGTGLAGLSAATVMVPILIVLCPSFIGETGAYQASAIALASDIIGSAVTSYTYAKHKNIDLKRGWIMFVTIVIMCTIGSWAAWLAGNVVLGTFTLFLTVGIGIRFLVKPDTTRKETVSKGEKLNLFGIIISLFFGLTIGFGTGFVGSGGGMMMLVVFTAFLGMDLKSAVGTSTFIMTFTALIASVSHMMIHPAIVFEKWPILLLCMSVATFTSLYSARFANRVSNRTIGLCTGGILTVLGIVLLSMHYWTSLSTIPFLKDTLINLGRFILFIIPCLIVLLALYFFSHIPKYVFRKCLHLVAFSCITFMLMIAPNYQSACATSLSLIVIVYPILSLLEGEEWFPKLFVEKKKGEVKNSLIMLMGMFAFITLLAWGILNKKYLVGASILMWGFGDGMAALVGIPLGKHKVSFADGKKSWEGTVGMFIASLLVGLLYFGLYSKYSLPYSLLLSSSASLVGALVELISASTWDTVTVPISILIVLSIL